MKSLWFRPKSIVDCLQAFLETSVEVCPLRWVTMGLISVRRGEKFMVRSLNNKVLSVLYFFHYL